MPATTPAGVTVPVDWLRLASGRTIDRHGDASVP